MSNKLQGKVAVVTGSSKGIGAEIAKKLAAEGASVVVNYGSSADAAARVVSEIESKGGKALGVQADVSKPGDIAKLFAETKRVFGRLDVLVNNAGVYGPTPLGEITLEEFQRQFGLNVFGLTLATQEAVKYFDEAGGSVINIGSAVSRAAFPGMGVYTATKGAVDALTRTFAAELGPKQIRVNTVSPGMVLTEGNADMAAPGSPLRTMIEAQTPLGRIGQVDDIAPAVAFLASDDSAWITGELFFISGGMRG
ncbi:SDR family NAD(P)-dependent oxidoreductase [Haliangium ochraceum]|uniref:Short-chain dehydrogenase/reductase SDR n=1 Tax=Haliangium ochraceum (strain DSM 14365 / JCM 11303 / SMP-2) TaxID=502025 RepID=D0LWN5_HALO1|nr:glucose 1-dehydrogenase [Haliangium ochraceum]ACY17685.1 short-chain dehydrogenase/reductase SDR [Haliangium ochraceum DSM 14365]